MGLKRSKSESSQTVFSFSGKSTDKVEASSEELHGANVTVFAIGVGRNYDIDQLKVIASKPEEKYTLTADFNRLNDLYSSIRDDACRGEAYISDRHDHMAMIMEEFTPATILPFILEKICNQQFAVAGRSVD